MPWPPRRHVSLDPGSLKGKQLPQAGPLWVSLQQSEVRRPREQDSRPRGCSQLQAARFVGPAGLLVEG